MVAETVLWPYRIHLREQLVWPIETRRARHQQERLTLVTKRNERLCPLTVSSFDVM